MIAIVFLSASYAYRSGTFVRVTIALNYVSPRVRLVADYRYFRRFSEARCSR